MSLAFPFSPAPPLPAARRNTFVEGGYPGLGAATQAIGQQKVPVNVRARMSGFGEPINLAQTLDLAKLEASVRTSERGDVWNLYTIFRDMYASWGHLRDVWSVRKMPIIGQPFELLPRSKSLEDKRATEHIQQMIEECENWQKGLIHILNGQLYPASVTEKIFEPAIGDEILPVRWRLKKLFPVSELLHCYKIPYLPQSVLAQPGYRSVYPPSVASINSVFDNPALAYDPDSWEPDLRLFDVFENGMVNRNFGSVYAPDPIRHFIYHGSASSESVRENYGGELRSIATWWFFATIGRAAFARFMERFGQPIPIILADMQQGDTIQFLTQAWQDSFKVGAMFLDKNSVGDATIDKLDVKTESSAQAYETWLSYCEGQVTRQIIGQELSHAAKPTGMNSGNAALQGEVRQDIRAFDTVMLNHGLKQQLFTPYLKMNGIPGRSPDISFGGIDPKDAKLLGETLGQLARAKMEPTDKAMDNIGKRLGFEVQKSSTITVPGGVPGKEDENVNNNDEDDNENTTQDKPVKRNLSSSGLLDTAALSNVAELADSTVPEREGWTGYDLDGTLAKTGKGNAIGDPIQPMLDRLRADLRAGKSVKIVTARAANPKAIPAVKRWLAKQGLPDLEVTNEKDHRMQVLYDDKARHVISNTGIVADDKDGDGPRRSLNRVIHQHDKIRSNAQARYRQAMKEFTDQAETGVAKKTHSKEKLAVIFAALMLAAARDAYTSTYVGLSSLEPPKNEVTIAQVMRQADEFARFRSHFLLDVPSEVMNRFYALLETIDKDTPEMEVRALLHEATLADKNGFGVADTEAQATYGSAQHLVLRRAGYHTQAWQQVNRPTRRESHRLNHLAGEVTIGHVYANGQSYPGDAAGGASECANCQCSLLGISK